MQKLVAVVAVLATHSSLAFSPPVSVVTTYKHFATIEQTTHALCSGSVSCSVLLASTSEETETIDESIHPSQVEDTEVKEGAIENLSLPNYEGNEQLITKQEPIELSQSSSDSTSPTKERVREAIPQFGKKDELDRDIITTAIPNMINFAVVPIVNSVDTFWVGRLGVALALAGQSAANQASFTLYFLIAFLPSITAPLVATAIAEGKSEEAQKRVCESIFLCNVLGLLGTIFLVRFPHQALRMVLPAGAPAIDYAAPYLRWRALSIIPSLISSTGFAAYRGMLNTVTPLKVSLLTNAINLILDPLCIFSGGFGFIGAAVATATSEAVGGLVYLRLLLRRKLARWSLLLKPPSWQALAPLLRGGAAMLMRQVAINFGFIMAARRAQAMDPTGVSAAAYGIVMQIYSVGIVILLAMQSTAAALVPSSLAKSGENEARKYADRLLSWGLVIGGAVGLANFLAVPLLVPVFSTLPEIQEAVKMPALITSLIHLVNGPVFSGEGIMMGLGCFKDLAVITSLGIGSMVACLASPLGKSLNGIMWSIMAFCALQNLLVVAHHLRFGPLARKKQTN